MVVRIQKPLRPIMRRTLLILLLAMPCPAGAQEAPHDGSGIVVTRQRTTPAGIETRFVDRVSAVRFGRDPGEIWVATENGAHRISWRENRVLERLAFDGRPGVHGLAVDPVGRRVLVSSYGRPHPAAARQTLPGSSQPIRRAVQLNTYDLDAAGTLAAAGERGPVIASGPVGDFIAGGPAVAARANASGRRVAVLPLPADDQLAVLDADDGTLIARVPVGVAPIAAAISADGSVAYVTTLGGRQPGPRDRAARQCCDPKAEPVRVDERGLAVEGNVTRVDLVAGRVTHAIPTGRHPTGIAWDTARGRLYVANGNDDAITVVDTRTLEVAGTLPIAPFRERRIGLAPTAVALSPDGATLYVALGGANAVAVLSVADPVPGRLRGLIPTGWYPSSVAVSPDGGHLVVGTLFGTGAGEGERHGRRGRYVHADRGSAHVVPVPTDAQLESYTRAVAENNALALADGGPGADALAPRPGTAPQPVPERPGEPSPIRHVVFIIRENRTFDQVLGDLGRGAGDSSLVMYGRRITPNTHALAERFVTIDHFFASGGNSADGHNWLTQANETDYPMWPLYSGRSYPSEGIDPLAYSSGGFIWESAVAAGRPVAVFGEYAPARPDTAPGLRRRLMREYLAGQRDAPRHFRDRYRALYQTRSEIPSLDRVLVREYPGWTMETPDVTKAEVILDHLRDWERAGEMPGLVLVNLPSNHTSGTSPGWCAPAACVADNDLALGKLVEGLSHSSFWPSMAILVVEDDAQDGVDHIDGHRTVALAISPWARRGAVDSTFYHHPSMVRTIELILGLPPLTIFDLTATEMRASFLGPGEAPDLTAYTALLPEQPLDAENPPLAAITGRDAPARRTAARASLRMNFGVPDAAPSDRLNRILWHDARGWSTPYPGVRHSVFVPMSVDLEDDEREEREEH